MPVHAFDPPDRFVVGTVGPPGQRVFFLQATSGRRLVSVSCEKEQVSVLAERVDDVLDEFALEATAEAEPEDNEPLTTPIEDEFRVVTLSLAWDPTRSVIVIEAYDADLSDEGDQAPGEVTGGAGAAAGATGDEGAVPAEPFETDASHSSVRVVLSPVQARSFVRRARALVSAGRPPCPFCGGPLDPTGHVCPRSNGYKR